MRRLLALWLLSGLVAAATPGCKSNPATVHREKGKELAAQSDWQKAADEYGLSLEADPKQEDLWEEKAYAHMQLKQFEQVETAMLKLAEFKTEPAKKSEVYRNLGGMYVQNGLNDKAEPLFLQAIKIDPKDDQALSWVAEIYAQKGGARATAAAAKPDALEKSLEYNDKVIALKPTESAAYVNKRIALMKYLEYEQQQKAAAQTDAEKEKDPVKKKELQTTSDQAQAEFDKRKKQMDEVTQKLSELAKAAQGK
jgi:Flp pilus assembly protein TadD